MVYVEVLECENMLTCQVPNKLLENTLRYTRSEEDLATYYTGGSTSPRDFNVYGSVGDFDDADCWSQEDDEIIQVGLEFFKGHCYTFQTVDFVQFLRDTQLLLSCGQTFICRGGCMKRKEFSLW